MAVPAPARETWIRRLFGWVARSLIIQDEVRTIEYGREFDSDYPVAPAFAPINSMSAFGEFPWVVAAASAIATDIAGLPLQAQRGYGESARALPQQPGLKLLRKPNSYTSSRLLREQMIIDLVLCGNVYLLKVGSPRVTSLVRLHPEEVEIIPGPTGGPKAYRFTSSGESVDYAPDLVIHVRSPSFRKGPQSLYGQGIIESLKVELGGEYAASKRWRDEAQRGRPITYFSPKDGAEIDTDTFYKVARRIQQQVNEHGSAAFGSEVEITTLPFNARDMEFNAARTWARASILAVAGVASTRLFLPDANFATAQQQSRTYWSNLLGVIAMINDGLSEVAAALGHPDDRIIHDTSGVEALQESRTDRLDRAVTLKNEFGLTPTAALAAEGFDDIDQSMMEPAGRPVDGAESDSEPDGEATSERSGLRLLVNRSGESMKRRDVGVTLKRLPLAGASSDEPDELIQNRFRFVASTSEVDRMGDIVEQSWRLDAFNANPVILWNHDSKTLPIGRAVDAAVVDGQLEIEMEMDMEDPFAAQVAGKLQRGFLSAGSVGFFPGSTVWRADLPEDDPRHDAKSWGIVASDNELVEFSITPVPANASALIAASADRASDDDLRALLADRETRQRLRSLLGDHPTTRNAPASGLTFFKNNGDSATDQPGGLTFLRSERV